MSRPSLKELMLAAPEGQLDAKMQPLVEKWDDEPTAIQVLEVLDWCIHCALGSDFVVSMLETFYELALKNEGKTREDMIPLATWREQFK